MHVTKNFFAKIIFLHAKLDEYLFDTELVQAKRNNYNAKQLAVDAEVQCPVCDKLMPKPRLREHCTRHFAEEITAIVHSFNKQEVCGLCDTKPRYVSARTWGGGGLILKCSIFNVNGRFVQVQEQREGQHVSSRGLNPREAGGVSRR